MNKYLLGLLMLCGCCLAAEPLKVSCTTYPVWLLTREITAGAKNVRTELMIPAGTGCPHEYVLTPGDMRKLAVKNLLVVRNGLGLDDFVLKPLRKMNPKAPVIDACAGLAILETECDHEHHDHHDHHGHHEHHGHKHHHANPHLFASPDTALGMVSNIADGLCRADPANAAVYRKNELALGGELRRLIAEMAGLKPRIAGKDIVVQHGVFDYLARALGLKIAAEIQSEGIAPSAAEMRKLAETIRNRKAAVIFTEPQYSPQTARTLARECGIKVCRLDPLSGGPENPPADYYVSVMRENLRKIRSSLER